VKALISLNAGSSSIKFSLFTLDDGLHLNAHGQIEKIGLAPALRVDDAQGRALHRQAWSDPTLTHEALLGALLDWAMGHLDGRELIGIGHRVVHGGAGFLRHVWWMAR
jgi:acetate kinase